MSREPVEAQANVLRRAPALWARGKATAPADTVKVIYIVGWGRSGSTILANLLGSVPGFFSAGELTYLREQLELNALCGCGDPLEACDVWSRILTPEMRHMLDVTAPLHNVVGLEPRRTWEMLRQEPGVPTGDTLVDAHLHVSGELYRAIAASVGARVVVDSSKRPLDAAIARLVPQARTRFVHLVRDPRATAHSWRTRKQRPEFSWPSELPRHSSIVSTGNWWAWNLAVELLARRTPNDVLRVRYEDFAAEPVATIRSIVEFAGEDPDDVPLSDDDGLFAPVNHTVAGNPCRFERGPVQIVPDRRWESEMAPSKRLVTTALSLPLAKRYGYSARPRPSSTA